MTEQNKPAIMWCVFHSDERQGESFVNGPFFDHAIACAWAERFAKDKAAEYVMDIECSDVYFAVMTRDSDREIVAEITVMELIPPYDR